MNLETAWQYVGGAVSLVLFMMWFSAIGKCAEELTDIRIESGKLREELRDVVHILKKINDRLYDISINNERTAARGEGLQESALGILEAAATNLTEMRDAICGSAAVE